MYCVKCGHPAEDGNVYCARCGAQLQKPLVIPEEDDVVQDTQTKRNPAVISMKPLLLIGSAVLILTSLVLLFLNFGAVKNWFIRSASSPEELLLIAYKSSVSSSLSPFVETYESVLTSVKAADSGVHSEITLKPGKQILDTLSYALYAEEGDLSWLSEIRLSTDLMQQDKLQECVLALELGNREIVSAEIIADSVNQKTYLSVPEMQPQWLMSAKKNDFNTVSPDMSKLYESLPSKQVLGQLAERYMDILLGGFSNVEKYSEEMTLDGISQDLTVLEAYIDHQDLLEVFAAVLQQAKTDEDIKQILEALNPWYNDVMEQSMVSYHDYFGTDYEPVDLYREWIAKIDASLSELEEEFKHVDPKNHLYLYTYLDDNNKIVGSKLMISGMDEPISWLTISKDNQFVCQILFGELQIAGSGTITESLNGTYSVQTGKEELMQIRAENLTRSKGTLYFEPSAFVLQQLAAEMQIADAADMADIVLCICFEENNTDSQCEFLVFSSDVSLMELHISGKATEYPNILLPENVTDAANEENIYNWLSGLDWEHLLENLSDAGVPEGLLEGLLSAAGAE